MIKLNQQEEFFVELVMYFSLSSHKLSSGVAHGHSPTASLFCCMVTALTAIKLKSLTFGSIAERMIYLVKVMLL